MFKKDIPFIDITEAVNILKQIPVFRKTEKEEITNVLYSFFKTLTKEEKFVIQSLFFSENPISVRQIRRLITTYVVLKNKDYIFDILKKEEKEIKKERPFSELINCFVENVLLAALLSLKEEEIEKFVSFLNRNLFETIPSPYKIRKVLEMLEKQNIVVRKELEDMRAENVYCLSPNFSRVLFIVSNYLEQKIKNKESTTLERELYELINAFKILH